MSEFQKSTWAPSADACDEVHMPAGRWPAPGPAAAVDRAAGAPSAPPSAGPLPSQGVKRGQRFGPKRLAILFLVVLAAGVAGTLASNALTNNGSSNNQAMSSWVSGYGATLLAVSHDTATINTSTNDSALRAACVKLHDDTNQAQSDPPMPISSLERQWSAIVSNLSVAADDCVKGIDQQSPSLLVTAQNHMDNALEADLRLVKAVQQVQ